MPGPISRGPDAPSAEREGVSTTAEAAWRIPILTYHSLDRSGSAISVAPRAFEAHMRGLARRGFKGVTLAALLAAWREGASLPAKPVVLSFDDGFDNFLDHAAPLLAELDFGATVFAVAGFLGGTNDWDASARVPRLPLLAAGQIRELAGRGFEIGGHSMTHRRLVELSVAELANELADSRKMLEDVIGRSVASFAYPYGAWDAATRRVVERTYSIACGVRLAVARRSDDLLGLPRVDMYYFRSRAERPLLCTRTGDAYLTIRRAGRALRRKAPEATLRESTP